jgi:hypothetical protein
MREFASYRVPYMRTFIDQQFSNPGTATLKMTTSPLQSGNIQLNTLLLASFPWEGIYFNHIPVRITARPNPGYRFVRWQGPVEEPLSVSTTAVLDGYTTITAIYEEDGSGLNHIVINEIYFNDPPGFDADDWIELYNQGAATVDLSGWLLQDADTAHRFIIPSGTPIYPNDYLVISRNVSKYRVAYPDAPPAVGDFSFGLGSSGDCIKLITGDGFPVDSICYGVEDPWPVEPKIDGVSLELRNPIFDNSLAVNWMASVPPHGTPGKSNTLISGNGESDQNPSAAENMLECFPNPFTVFTRIRFEVPSQDLIRLSVYDLQGHLVHVLYEGETGPGIKEIIWDGYGSDGTMLGPGIYIGLLETGNSIARCRMVIVR